MRRNIFTTWLKKKTVNLCSLHALKKEYYVKECSEIKDVTLELFSIDLAAFHLLQGIK